MQNVGKSKGRGASPYGVRLSPRKLASDASSNDARIQAANPKFKFPKLVIAVVSRQDGSGTTFAFTNHLPINDVLASVPDFKQKLTG